MSEGGLLKPEKDFSKEVDAQLPEAEKLAKVGEWMRALLPRQRGADAAQVTELLTDASTDQHPGRHREARGAREADPSGTSPLELDQPSRGRPFVKLTSTRQASDLASTSRILVAVVTISKDVGDWGLMNDQMLVFSKKHSQLKQAITKMVQTVIGFLDETPDLKTKLSVIETLRTVTEGKIFVEVERARITRILSDIKKEQGDHEAAKDILCELQVETFGSMSRREKTEFILAQVSLCIDSGDWTQAGILGRKISTRYLARKPKKTQEQLDKEQKEIEKKKARGEEVEEEKEDDTTDLKLRYYEQQIQLAKQDNKYLDVCKHYRQVLDTEAVEEDPEKLKPVSFARPR